MPVPPSTLAWGMQNVNRTKKRALVGRARAVGLVGHSTVLCSAGVLQPHGGTLTAAGSSGEGPAGTVHSTVAKALSIAHPAQPDCDACVSETYCAKQSKAKQRKALGDRSLSSAEEERRARARALGAATARGASGACLCPLRIGVPHKRRRDVLRHTRTHRRVQRLAGECVFHQQYLCVTNTRKYARTHARTHAHTHTHTIPHTRAHTHAQNQRHTHTHAPHARVPRQLTHRQICSPRAASADATTGKRCQQANQRPAVAEAEM